MTQSLAPFGCFSGNAGKNLKKRLTLLKKTNPPKKIIILRQKKVIIFFVWFVLFPLWIEWYVSCAVFRFSPCVSDFLCEFLSIILPHLSLFQNWIENVLLLNSREENASFFFCLWFCCCCDSLMLLNTNFEVSKNYWNLCFVCLYVKFNWGWVGNVFKSSINIIKSQKIGKYDHFLLCVFHCV